jgi:nitrate/nitrite transporter NarK
MTPEWKRGWPIVVSVAAVIGTGGALWGYVSSLFIPGITAEFGWTRGDLALISSFAAIGGLSAPFLGWATDRFGARPVAILGTLALALMYLALTAARTQMEFQLAAVGIGAFITASGALVIARPIIQWFDKSRGLALGLATLGASIAGIGVPVLMQLLVSEYGWRAGYQALAFSAAFICVPIVYFFIRERPGASHHVDDLALTDFPDGAPDLPRLMWHQVIRKPTFWLLAIALFGMNLAGSGLLSQMAVLLQDKGISPVMAATGISIFAASVIVGRVGCGFLLDRFPPEIVACAFTIVPAIGCAALITGNISFGLAAIAVAFAGLQQGAETDVLAYFISRVFGAASFSIVFGMIATIGILGTVMGSVMFGLIHDRTGDYDLALMISVGCFLSAAWCLLATGPIRGR